MTKKLLLIDGHNLLFQMFFGMPSKIPDSKGRDIRGVIGFIGAMRKLIRMLSPTHVAVLFDSETHNPRSELLDEYKANRPDYSEAPDEGNPFTQLPIIYSALDRIGIRHAEIADAECDDVIATYALTRDPDTEIIISSFDSDYFQLITDSVKIVRYRGDNSTVCDVRYIEEKLGIEPCQYADFKSLTGDTADNVPGVRGIGKKTAAKLIRKYGSIEAMLSSTDSDKALDSVKAATDVLGRNLALIKLDPHAPKPFPIDDLLLSADIPPTTEILRALGI